jgi:hypothetical protein
MNNDKPHRKRPAKSSTPSVVPVSNVPDLASLPVVYPYVKYPGQDKKTKGKEASTAATTNKPSVVQPPPLTTPSQAAPSVEVQGTSAPSFGASFEPSPMVYPDDGYVCDSRYGGQLPTRFNSSQVDDREAHARADFLYHQVNRHLNPAPGYDNHFSAAYSDQGVYSQGLRTSFEEHQREFQAPTALDRMERILERIESASSASSLHQRETLQSFLGQGEFYFLFSLKLFEICSSLFFNPFHGVCRGPENLYLNFPLGSSFWKEVGWPQVSLQPTRITPKGLMSVAKYNAFLNIVSLGLILTFQPFVDLVLCNLVDMG